MPPQLPAHRELVLLSGAVEVAGGLGVLTPGLEKPARWGLIALLLAVFPANVHMALSPAEHEGRLAIQRWLLWARLPFQAVFIVWVVRATETDR